VISSALFALRILFAPSCWLHTFWVSRTAVTRTYVHFFFVDSVLFTLYFTQSHRNYNVSRLFVVILRLPKPISWQDPTKVSSFMLESSLSLISLTTTLAHLSFWSYTLSKLHTVQVTHCPSYTLSKLQGFTLTPFCLFVLSKEPNHVLPSPIISHRVSSCTITNFTHFSTANKTFPHARSATAAIWYAVILIY